MSLVRRLALLTVVGGAAPLGTPWATNVPARSGEVRAGPLSESERAAHALNRLAFGPRPGDLDRLRAMGVDRWVDQQLSGQVSENAQVAAALATYPSLDKSARELVASYPLPNVLRRLRDSTMTRADSLELRRAALEGRAFLGELLSARIARAVASERQLDEVMVDFWLNHFNVYAGKNQVMRYYLPEYEREAIRPHVLGRFRELLGAVAKSPAMLVYLDNAQSVADSGRPTLASREVADRRLRRALERRPLSEQQRAVVERLQARRPKGLNENYARELMELHTLGVDGGYTQRDVIEVARALTGWTVRPPLGARRMGGDAGDFIFNPVTHDVGEKEVLGHRLSAGRGLQDGEDVLDIVAAHPSTARHLARKLVQRFVNDAPPESLVERAARRFRETDGDLRETVRIIVTSEEFFSREAYRSKVKSPFEVVVSTVRALGGSTDSTVLTASVVARLGQPLYGHQAPNGYPEVSSEWMNTGAILGRINFGLMAASGRIPGASPRDWSAYSGLVTASRERQVDVVMAALLGDDTSPETRQVLATGRNPLLDSAHDSMAVASADAMRSAGGMERGPDRARERRTAGRRAMAEGIPLSSNPDLSGLDLIVGLALGAPEFQKR